MALWVEKHHGDAGHEFIATKIDQLMQPVVVASIDFR